MASLKDMRNRIGSVKATQKITKAMQMVAAAKLRKAQNAAQDSRPYAQRMAAVIANLAAGVSGDGAPKLLVGTGSDQRHLVVIATSDRGLAGGFSSQVIREANELRTRLEGEGREVVNYLVGRKAVQYYAFRRRVAAKEWMGGTDQPTFETAKDIADTLVEAFIAGGESDGGVDEIHIVYNRFVSLVTQTPEIVRVLPLEVVDGVEEPGQADVLPLYEFEPEVDAVLDSLLPVYIESRIFNAMLQSAASEHAARQKAMKSATDNADKLIREYTRLANNARQAEITQQISEIVGGADALGSAK